METLCTIFATWKLCQDHLSEVLLTPFHQVQLGLHRYLARPGLSTRTDLTAMRRTGTRRLCPDKRRHVLCQPRNKACHGCCQSCSHHTNARTANLRWDQRSAASLFGSAPLCVCLWLGSADDGHFAQHLSEFGSVQRSRCYVPRSVDCH